jgi:outer membrane lipoprotein
MVDYPPGFYDPFWGPGFGPYWGGPWGSGYWGGPRRVIIVRPPPPAPK